VFGNPLIQRYKYSLMRPRQFWVYMSIYITIALLVFFINYSGYQTGDIHKTLTDLFKSMFYQFVILQIIVLWIWSPFNSGSAIRDEVTEKTYDFFRMLPLSAYQKAQGILAGKNLIAILIACCNFVIMASFGIAAKLNISLIMQIFLLLISIALLANFMALLFSINPKGKKSKAGIIVFILIAFFIGPMILQGVFALADKADMESTTGWFFELKISVLLLASLVALYFSCWCIKGVLRKFVSEDEPVFTRTGAILFLLGYELVLLGLFYRHLRITPAGYMARDFYFTYLFLSMAAILLIPPASIRNMDKYLEYAGILISRPSSKRSIFHFISFSNLTLWAGLFLLWACFIFASSFFAKMPLTENLLIIAVSLSFYFFILLLLEISVLVSSYAPKIGLLMIFILVLYIILPPILAGIFDQKLFSTQSPFGYFIFILVESQRDLTIDATVLLINLLLCIVPTIVVLSRYTNIISARQKMPAT
jgi:hypothetical protein